MGLTDESLVSGAAKVFRHAVVFLHYSPVPKRIVFAPQMRCDWRVP